MRVMRGRALIQRFFDVADEIELQSAQQLVQGLARRPKFVRSAKRIRLPDPPLEMALLPRYCGVPNTPEADVLVRVYNTGTVVVSFALELPSGLDTEQLIDLSARISDAEDAITEAARPVCREIADAIAPASKPGAIEDLVEDYTVFWLVNTEPQVTASTFLEQVDVPRLLLGERHPIDGRQRAQLTQECFSYYPDEVVVLDWQSALVLDPRASYDVPDLLELASAQLLALRSYDAVVGRALDQLYNELEVAQRRFSSSARYIKLSRRMMRVFVEVAEMAERIDNSLEFIGDTWLARIHGAAVKEFDIPRWQKQLRGKLDMLQSINQHLVDQITTRRGLIAEYAIVILIVFEILFK